MFLATHGWLPWLLLYAGIIVAVLALIVYFVRRRKAS